MASKVAEVSIQAQHRYSSLALLPPMLIEEPKKREVAVLKVVVASEDGLASSRVCHHPAPLLVWRRLLLAPQVSLSLSLLLVAVGAGVEAAEASDDWVGGADAGAVEDVAGAGGCVAAAAAAADVREDEDAGVLI